MTTLAVFWGCALIGALLWALLIGMVSALIGWLDSGEVTRYGPPRPRPAPPQRVAE